MKQDVDLTRLLHSFPVADMEAREESDSLRLEGYGVKWDTPEELYSFQGITVLEQVSRGAWDDEARSQTVYLRGHNWSGHVFASVPSGTMTVREDDTGLLLDIGLDPEQTIARDLYSSVKRGDSKGQSVGFSVGTGFKESMEELDDETVLYTIERSPRLYEVSSVWNPAYKSSTLDARGIIPANQLHLRMMMRHGASERLAILERAILKLKEPEEAIPEWKAEATRRARIGRQRIAALSGRSVA